MTEEMTTSHIARLPNMYRSHLSSNALPLNIKLYKCYWDFIYIHSVIRLVNNLYYLLRYEVQFVSRHVAKTNKFIYILTQTYLYIFTIDNSVDL